MGDQIAEEARTYAKPTQADEIRGLWEAQRELSTRIYRESTERQAMTYRIVVGALCALFAMGVGIALGEARAGKR